MVTYRNGKSKGIAYVEFEDEQSTSKALMQTDNMLIGEHQISVAISNPPKRAKDSDSAPLSKLQLASSLGGGSINNRGVGSLSATAAGNSTGAPQGSSQRNAPSSSVSSFLPRSQLVRKKALNL